MANYFPLPERIVHLLRQYEGEVPGVKANLARLLMHGRLKGTGRLLILPVDQGFEHGPGRSFSMNPSAYDPHFHYQLASEAGLSALAAPLGFLEAGIDTFVGQIPIILKLNSSNSLQAWGTSPRQSRTACVKDALRLGASAIGLTLYPGSGEGHHMIEDCRDLIAQARSCGLPTVVWAYPRGGLSKQGETALDVVAYSAHMAVLLGAHIVKVKLPTSHLEQESAAQIYRSTGVARETAQERVRHIMQACFQGRRLVVFSGGAACNANDLYTQACAIAQGGGNGSIIGRNIFQRPKEEALLILDQVVQIYQNTPLS